MAKRKGVYARDIDQLNFIFALVGIGCLLSVGWMIWDDYAREWKEYQREFRVIEQEVTEAQLQEVEAQVDQQRLSQLEEQRAQAEQTLQGQEDALAALRGELEQVQVDLDLATQRFRFARSTYDARRYAYEEAAQEGGDVEDERRAMEAAEARVEETETRMEDLTRRQQELRDRIATLRADVEEAEAEITATTREIDRLRSRLDDLRFGLVYYLRNAPMLDALNPSLRIGQTVINDLHLDLNFANAPRVDRCQTCHLGASNAAYADYSQPFTSHPELDLFVADTSVHPAGEFGCSVCHLGKGRGTSFLSAEHTPSNDAEEERWVEEYDWAPNHLWEWPMRSVAETEASCLKCHIGDTWMPDAPKLEYGLDLIDSLGCYGCHALDRFEDRREVGPSLEHVSSKTTPEWAFGWVRDPKEFRPDTRMPRFFGLANNSDAYWQRRNVVEIDAIVGYIFANSTDVDLQTAPQGDVERGRTLVDQVGCLGCHIVEEPDAEDYPADQPRFSGPRHKGPNLHGLGSKVNADWLYTWLRDPKHYWPETEMPNLRLTDGEAADITAYLMSLTRPEWEERQEPSADSTLRDEVTLEYLRGQLTAADARQRLDGMSTEDKRRYLGEQLISRYGCYGCHVIPGFEDLGRIGTELSEWGSKPVSRIDFAYLDIPHERRPFLEVKLRAPRTVDQGKVKQPQELARMPNFGLEEAEIDAIATAVLGYTNAEVPESKLPPQTPRRVALEKGRRLVQKYGCRNCHVVEGRGGDIQQVIVERRGQRYGESEAVAAAYAPPNLNTEGAKTQPDWLYGFLRDPSEQLRPWLNVRMPTFDFTDQELNDLTAYFAALDEAPYPFDARFSTAHRYPDDLVQAGEEMARGQLQCFRCHVRGGETPNEQPETWAPDLALATDRLRYEWVQDWIADPQSIFPGTRMPAFFQTLEPGSSPYDFLDRDPRRQIEALAAYIMSIGQS